MFQRLFAAVLATAGLASAASAGVMLDWVNVGNTGNAPDPETGFGAVPYAYAISKTEVTNAQYAEFLNAVDPLGRNELDLYDSRMANSIGGIESRLGRTGERYAAKPGREQNPVTYVSFFDAMRFANWLHNGQGVGDTESGAYAISRGVNESRSADATFWIPSEDEWYKAAYHDASSGTAGVYFDYANSSDTLPVSDQPWDNPAAANYLNNDFTANGFNDGYAVSGQQGLPVGANPFTDVGAYSEALSPYGTLDQNGNAAEWTEGVFFSNFSRAVRGGSWNLLPENLRSENRIGLEPIDGAFVGIRIATFPVIIPEPSTFLLMACAAVGVAIGRR